MEGSYIQIVITLNNRYKGLPELRKTLRIAETENQGIVEN